MAGAVVTGLAEAKRRVEALPDTMQTRLRGVALSIGERARVRARDLCRKDSEITADSIGVFPGFEDKQVRVEVGPSPRSGRTAFLPNLPNWIEYGTVKMPARPFMRPARESVDDAYRNEMTRAAQKVAEETFR